MIVYYDGQGHIVGTLDYLVKRENGKAVGHHDFEAHEFSGGKLRQFGEFGWTDDRGGKHLATGAGTWPEKLPDIHHHKVVLDEHKRIVALVHRISGEKRHRPG